MPDDRFYDICQKLTDQLHTTTTNMEKLLANHEARITVLESSDKKQGVIDSDMVRWLIKALVTAITVIGGLAGVVKMTDIGTVKVAEVHQR